MIIVGDHHFRKALSSKMFSLHTKTQSQHSQIPPALKSVSEKLRFRDGLAD